ncbi:MAG: SIMPL domain-containing protein [Anaerolineae bacterium]|nr:SIMPL domain-containing protein [Anaerolineae bacterium]
MSLKKLVLTVVLVMIVAAPAAWSAVPAGAQGDSLPRTITVVGQGVSYGAPDVVRIGLGVEAVNEDVLLAMNESNSRMEAVMQVLRDNGVAADDIRTENFSIYQERSYGMGDPMEQTSAVYRVFNGLVITLRDTTKVGELLSAAVSAGANMVNYVQFDIDNRIALESNARALAVDNARARAEELAGMLGLAVGDPVSVSEGGPEYYSPMMGGGGGGAFEAAAVPISGGTLSVSVSVTITFQLVAAS